MLLQHSRDAGVHSGAVRAVAYRSGVPAPGVLEEVRRHAERCRGQNTPASRECWSNISPISSSANQNFWRSFDRAPAKSSAP